jgi:hypothetical protein
MSLVLRDVIDTGIPGFIVAAIVLLSCEIGFRVGRRVKKRADDALRSEILAIQAASLSLLALLLGFSFSIGSSSYSNRKQVILSEVSTIGDAYYHADLLPEPARSEVRGLLIQYIDTREDLYQSNLDEEAVRRKILESRRLGREIWSRAAAVAKQQPQSIPVGLLLQSLSAGSAMNAKRVASLTPSLPAEMLIALALATMVAMGWVGVGIGLGPRRSLGMPVILALLFGFIIAIIFDLDQPRRGVVRVSERALNELKQTLQQSP